MKLFALILAVSLTLCLCACAENNAPADPAPAPTVPTPEPTEPPTEHTHHYAMTEELPTCTRDGALHYNCACGHSYSEPIVAEGHVYGEWYVIDSPSMIGNGMSQRDCQNCEYFETREIPPNTLEQEVETFMTTMLSTMPGFKSVDQLSGGIVFDWATCHIPKISWEMDENYTITIVYSIDELDDFTRKYLGTTFDYYYLEEYNKDFMSFDREKREVTVITGASGGGGYKYSVDTMTEMGTDHYVLRYLAVDPYVEDPIANGFYHYGNLEFKIVDGHLQILSHTKEQ
ncbi:MAG: hypothetical protein E7436_07985 [Ruminococcaceae bacterium]|nr:hypothetical protein [Oscillospiraceae bacterium]